MYARGIWVSKLGNNSVQGSMVSALSNNSNKEENLPNEKYSGNFSNDVFHGEGIYIDSQGKVFEGMFKNGKKDMERL